MNKKITTTSYFNISVYVLEFSYFLKTYSINLLHIFEGPNSYNNTTFIRLCIQWILGPLLAPIQQVAADSARLSHKTHNEDHSPDLIGQKTNLLVT